MELLDLSPIEFERLCLEVLRLSGYENIEWFGRGGGDRGRDLVATKRLELPAGDTHETKWIIQCKRYRNNVSKKKILDSLSEASQFDPDYWLLCTTGHLTSNTRDWLRKQSQRWKLRVVVWDLVKLQRVLDDVLPDWRRIFFVNLDEHIASVSPSERMIIERQIAHLAEIQRFPLPEFDRLPIERTLVLFACRPEALHSSGTGGLTFEEVLTNERTSVILGEPGSGKSTNMQRLAVDTGRKFLEGMSDSCTLLSDLRWYRGDITALLEETIRIFYPKISSTAARSFLDRDGLILLLDGFEEVPDRTALLRDLRSLALRRQVSKILVTSRVMGGLDQAGFVPFEMDRLGPSQVKQILDIYLEPHFSPSIRERLFLRIQCQGLLTELGNPMFLWFFSVWLRHQEGNAEDLSRSKGAIIDAVVDRYFLRAWERERFSTAQEDMLLSKVKDELLTVLARVMIEKEDTTVIEESEAIRIVGQSLNRRFDRIEHLIALALDSIVKSRLLITRDRRLSFWHKSIRNYYAARSLLSQKESMAIQDFVGQERWNESLVIVCGLSEEISANLLSTASIDVELALECLINSIGLVSEEIMFSSVELAVKELQDYRSIRRCLLIGRRLVTLGDIAPEQLFNVACVISRPRKFSEFRQQYDKVINESTKSSFSEFVENLRHIVGNAGISCSFQPRIKSPWSCFRKMYMRSVSLREIFDVFGVKVVVSSIRECYELLGVSQSHYKPIPGRFKDYIAMPKFDLYQALHTTVVSGSINVAVIIQTDEIELFSGLRRRDWFEREYGSASKAIEETISVGGTLPFSLVTQGTPSGALAIRTRDEDVFFLRVGATVLDIAYKIHTNVGHRCSAAKVNGRSVPLGYSLADLDTVEVFVGEEERVDPERPFLVNLSSSKKKIRRLLGRQDRAKVQEKGNHFLQKILKHISDNRPDANKCINERLASVCGLDVDGLIERLGRGRSSPEWVIERIRRRGSRHGLKLTEHDPK